jgi:PIN domain nuclease of toxin-antitoxin system
LEGRLRLLLDTHVVVWVLHDPDRLRPKTRAAIGTEENETFVSAVTPWELAIKGPREGLRIPDDLEAQVDRRGFNLLPVLFRHTELIGSMPYHHRDPFDRMLVAQAITDGLTIVTADRKMTEYQVGLVPAI